MMRIAGGFGYDLISLDGTDPRFFRSGHRFGIHAFSAVCVVQIKEGTNFNRRNTLSISRIKI